MTEYRLVPNQSVPLTQRAVLSLFDADAHAACNRGDFTCSRSFFDIERVAERPRLTASDYSRIHGSDTDSTSLYDAQTYVPTRGPDVER